MTAPTWLGPKGVRLDDILLGAKAILEPDKGYTPYSF